MNFYELKAFSVLAEKLHFAKTAQIVNISPSALSRIITRLEEETGSLLVDRSSRQVILTRKGRIFADFARKALEDESEILRTLSAGEKTISGTLHVYASVTACYTILPYFIKKLAAKYPDIQLEVETGDPAGAVPAVRDGRAALAIDAIPEDGLSNLETISVLKTPLIYAAANTSRYTAECGSPQDIISSVPLVLPKTGLARRRFDKWAKSRNVKPIIAAEAEGNEAVLALAHLGIGIALVPKIVLETGPYSQGFKILETGSSLGFYDVGFIRRAEVHGTKSLRGIQQAVSEILHSSDWSKI